MTTRRTARAGRLRVLAVTALTTVLALTGATAATAAPHRQRFPETFPLPTGWQPEGITIGHGPTAYLGSLADGDIYAADLRTGEGRVISQGPGSPSVGLKVDRHGRLYVAGGPSGTGRLVDTRSGEILLSWSFTSAPSFVNDVVLTRDKAWFTDSQQAQLYGVQRVRGAGGSPSTEFTVLPLTGDWQQAPGFNANGIAETPDHRALLVVKSNTGELFRVDPATGHATLVDLGGSSLANGDGLLVRGRTLYVVQNLVNQVAVVRLSADGRSGRLVRTLTDPDLDVPTTVAAFRGSLYLPNARFGIPSPETAHYDVVRLGRH